MVHHSSGGFFGIRLDDWKFIDELGSGGFSHPAKLFPEEKGPNGQLYNLKEDALESQNLYFLNPEKVAELSSFLKKIVKNGHSRENTRAIKFPVDQCFAIFIAWHF